MFQTLCNYSVNLIAAITEEVKGAQTWLAHGRQTWPTVLNKWEATAPLRFKDVFKSGDGFINAYILEWPVLQHNSGYELVCTTSKVFLFKIFWGFLISGWYIRSLCTAPRQLPFGENCYTSTGVSNYGYFCGNSNCF